MKKILFASILLFACLGSNVFAGHVGDLQFRMPGFSSSKGEGSSERTNTVDFGFATYQNWYIVPNVVGVGFMIETDWGFKIEDNGKNNTGAMNVLIGPSACATLGSVVRLELGLGLNIGYSTSYYTYETPAAYGGMPNVLYTTTNLFGAGFGFDFAAVFFPKARFSPLVGFNFSTLSGHGKAKTTISRYSGTKPKIPDEDVDVKSNSFKMFIGGCFNFGDR